MLSKPRPILAEMPWNIKQDIIDSTDFRTRCVLRKCSKTLRSQVNDSNAFLFTRIFVFSDDTVELGWANEDGVGIDINYRPELDGCSVNGKFLFGENYIERSVADFAAVARHPKTLVDYVLVRRDRWMLPSFRTPENQRILRIFEKEFASSPMGIDTLQFDLRSNKEDVMRVLALTRPGILKFIGFIADDGWQDTDELVASEHWRMAREVQMLGFRNIPAWSLVHFQKWHVDEMQITELDARAFVEKIFEFGESFERGDCRTTLTLETLNYFMSNFDLQIEGNELMFDKKMPGTMYHLRITIRVINNISSHMRFSKVLSSEIGK